MNRYNTKGNPIDGDYFHRNLLFLNIDDFYINRDIIKARLEIEDISTLYYYRLYVYSRPFVTEIWKSYIWDYLMGDMNETDFIHTYFVYRKRPFN